MAAFLGFGSPHLQGFYYGSSPFWVESGGPWGGGVVSFPWVPTSAFGLLFGFSWSHFFAQIRGFMSTLVLRRWCTSLVLFGLFLNESN